MARRLAATEKKRSRSHSNLLTKIPTCSHKNRKKFQSSGESKRTYHTPHGSVVVRLKECKDCGARFQTFEMLEETPEGPALSDCLLILLRNALISNRNPIGWYWLYTPEQARQHFKKLLPHGYTWLHLSEGRLEIVHISSIESFGYPLPGTRLFNQAWALKNLSLQPKE